MVTVFLALANTPSEIPEITALVVLSVLDSLAPVQLSYVQEDVLIVSFLMRSTHEIV